jgi:hypothetical protein
MKTIFKAAKGSMFSDEQAEVYGKELYKLRKEKELLTPLDVVNAAKSPKSLLHEYFEWEDSIAGEKYRLYQARHLIGHIEIVIEEEPIKAFHNIKVEINDEKNRGYITIQDIQQNPDYLDLIVEKAKEEIESWTRRYDQYRRLSKFKTLRPIFRAIEQAIA